jgi:hypothetical protein
MGARHDRGDPAGLPTHRTADVLERINLEWKDEPTREAALAMLPDLVRWCAEQTNLAPDLAEDAISAAVASVAHEEDAAGQLSHPE